jgi:hypothetical protein
MTKLLCILCVLFSFSVTAENFAECILNDLPGVKNDIAAKAGFQQCEKKYPKGYSEIYQGEGRGLFGYNSGDECTIDKAKETPSRVGGYVINVACYCLYNEPENGRRKTCK